MISEVVWNQAFNEQALYSKKKILYNQGGRRNYISAQTWAAVEELLNAHADIFCPDIVIASNSTRVRP